MNRRLVIAAFVVFARSATAGLYDPDKPEPPLPGVGPAGLPFEIFRDRLDDVIRMGLVTPETAQRRAAVAARDALAAKPGLTVADHIRLGVLRLRLREFDASLSDLQRAYAADPRNFWAMTALGTAYQQAGDTGEAVRRLEAARDLTPEPWPSPPHAAEVAARLEAAQLRLVRLRLREQGGRGGRLRPAEDVDDLFGVPVADSGKLPEDAVVTVQRLLMWLPDDTRLYWLLGELYRARGELDAALAVFNECLDSRRFDAAKLRESRQAVKAAIAARPAAAATGNEDWHPGTGRWLAASAVAGVLLLALLYFQLRQLRRSGVGR